MAAVQLLTERCFYRSAIYVQGQSDTETSVVLSFSLLADQHDNNHHGDHRSFKYRAEDTASCNVHSDPNSCRNSDVDNLCHDCDRLNRRLLRGY